MLNAAGEYTFTSPYFADELATSGGKSRQLVRRLRLLDCATAVSCPVPAGITSADGELGTATPLAPEIGVIEGASR